MRKFNKKASAFTLVEILVVILIIGLLFVFLVPKIDSATDKSRETGIKTDMRSYQTAFEAVAREHGGLGVQAITNGVDTTDATGKYIGKLVNQYLDPALQIKDIAGDTSLVKNDGTNRVNKKDPWNNEYHVLYLSGVGSATQSANNGTIAIYTTGKNAKGVWEIQTVASSVSALKTADASATDATAKTADKNVLESCVQPTEATADNAKDDYVLCTTCVDGEIFSATQGFTTNIKAF